MMITITQMEKRRAQEESQTIYSLIANQAPELFKVLVAYFERTAPSGALERLYQVLRSEADLANPELLLFVLTQMSEVAAADMMLTEKLYSTGELAKIFGMSITTIHNWIEAGRFIGVEKRTRNKQVRLSESTLWTSPAGARVSIKEVAHIYATQYSERIHTPMETLQAITSDITFFENKYHGEFRNTLGKKIDSGEGLSPEESRDAREWLYLLRKVGDE